MDVSMATIYELKRRVEKIISKKSFDEDVHSEIAKLRAINRLIANCRENAKCGTRCR
jgi:hypothetical protein